MKLLGSYLRRHYKIILMFLLFSGVFAAVFALYELYVEAVLYAMLLCLVIGAALFGVGYSRYLKRHRELRALMRSVTLSLDGLPAPKGALEEDYQALMHRLWNEVSEISVRTDTEKREMMDYYTLWAHQIKTPIAAMRLLLQSGHPEDTELSAELLRVEQYVEMVLSYLRLDSESSDYVLRECRLDDIVRGALRKYARLFILKKLPLNFMESGLTVLTDEKWLSFVIEQLLSNALKYTQTGGISIFTEDNRLTIADTGIGVREEDLPRVFDKGFTGYNGRENKKSTGIGLYLCRRVCEKLGHGISMESSQGIGTRVTLSFSRGERVVE